MHSEARSVSCTLWGVKKPRIQRGSTKRGAKSSTVLHCFLVIHKPWHNPDSKQSSLKHRANLLSRRLGTLPRAPLARWSSFGASHLSAFRTRTLQAQPNRLVQLWGKPVSGKNYGLRVEFHCQKEKKKKKKKMDNATLMRVPNTSASAFPLTVSSNV